MRRTAGFTLIEVLVVIAIISILAGILFTVAGSSKASSYAARETSQIHQIYVAVNLYEVDFDQKSPDSLVKLCPTYLSPPSLSCPTDTRKAIHPKDWPANPWVWVQVPGLPGDLTEDMELRSSFMNSYLYLKPFKGRFPAGRTFEEYRNDPEVGLITGIGLLNCVNSKSKDAIAGCEYRSKQGAIYPGQPPMNLAGTFLTVRTDGSVKVRRRSEACLNSDMGIDELFFFRTPACGNIPTVGQ